MFSKIISLCSLLKNLNNLKNIFPSFFSYFTFQYKKFNALAIIFYIAIVNRFFEFFNFFLMTKHLIVKLYEIILRLVEIYPWQILFFMFWPRSSLYRPALVTTSHPHEIITCERSKTLYYLYKMRDFSINLTLSIF